MKITLLGTGDAVGTPHVGCSCPQCNYAKEHGIQRLRTSMIIEHNGFRTLIDSTPDLRQQLLNSGSPHIDAVIWTHGHFDHFMGFGEFYRTQKIPPVYAAEPVMEYCAEIFGFLVKERHIIEPYIWFRLGDLEFMLVEVTHPPVYTCGVVVYDGKKTVGYTADTNEHIPVKTKEALTGVDMLFIDGLFPNSFRKITKHLNYEDACSLAVQLKAKDFRVVHMSHHIPFDREHQGRDGDVFII